MWSCRSARVADLILCYAAVADAVSCRYLYALRTRPQAWMKSNNVPTFAALESYYVQRIINMLTANSKNVVGA